MCAFIRLAYTISSVHLLALLGDSCILLMLDWIKDCIVGRPVWRDLMHVIPAEWSRLLGSVALSSFVGLESQSQVVRI